MYEYFHGFNSNIGCADKVLKLIDSLKINELPSDKNIKGWQQGLDGITYFIEYKVDKNYSFKNYWTPTSQDSLAEAQLLLLLISSFESLPDIKNSSKDFQNEIHLTVGYIQVVRLQFLELNQTQRRKTAANISSLCAIWAR